MALNTPENVTRLLQKLVEAINAGRDIGTLVSEAGLDNDDARSVIKTLTKRIGDLSTISRLSKRINELELNIQGTSTSEQNRIARDLASRRASSNKRKMSFYENLGGLRYKLDSRGNLIEASRYDYLRQKYYNRYAEFGDDGEVENISEASRIASILARRQVRNEREEEERKRQEKENAEKVSRQEANIGARGRYRDAMREIHDPSHMERRRLYESFLEVDESTGKSSLAQRKAAAKKAMEVLAAEKANTKGVNENTKALTGLRAFLGPYAKAVMPYYAMNLASQIARQDAQAGQFALSRKAFESTFVGDEGDVERYGSYADFRKRYFAAGGKHENVRNAFFNEISWATGLGLGEGVDRINKIALATGGRAPSSEIVNNPEALFKWYEEVIPTLDIKQRTNLSRIAGVGQDIIAAYSGKLGGKLGLQNIIAQEAGERNLGTSLVRHPIDYVSTWLQSNFPNMSRSVAEGGLESFWLQSIGSSLGIGNWTGLLENLVREGVAKTVNNNIYITTNLSGDEEVIRVLPKAIVNEISNAEK